LGTPGDEKTDEVGHVAAADQQSAAVGGIAKQSGYLPDNIRFHLAGKGRELPGSHVAVDRGSQKVSKNSDRCSRGSDVAPEPGVSVVQRVIEEFPGDPAEQLLQTRVTSSDDSRFIEDAADVRWRVRKRDSSGRNRSQKTGNLINQEMTQASELRRRHVQRRRPG
jgi:hypothetical protein